jgi:hypothetical protein
MFLIGILPGLLLVVVQLSLREPDKWLALRAAEATGRRPSPWQAFAGTLTGLFTTRRGTGTCCSGSCSRGRGDRAVGHRFFSRGWSGSR